MANISQSQLKIYLRPFELIDLTKDTSQKVLKLYKYIDKIEFQSKIEKQFSINPIGNSYFDEMSQYIIDNNFASHDWLEKILDSAIKKRQDNIRSFFGSFGKKIRNFLSSLDHFLGEYFGILLTLTIVLAFLSLIIWAGMNGADTSGDNKVYSNNIYSRSEFIRDHDGQDGKLSETLAIVPLDRNGEPMNPNCESTNNNSSICYNMNHRVQVNTITSDPIILQLEFKNDPNPIQVIELTPKPNPNYQNSKSLGYNASVIVPRDLKSAAVLVNGKTK